MDKIKYIGATSPWRDDLTGSGLTWTTGQEANVADHVGNVARGYTSHFQMVDDGVKVTADSSGTLYRDDTQSPVSGGSGAQTDANGRVRRSLLAPAAFGGAVPVTTVSIGPASSISLFGGATVMTVRGLHKVANADCADIVLVYSGVRQTFAAGSSAIGTPQANANSYTVKASIEYGGVAYPVTFRGVRVGTCEPHCLLESDPVGVVIPAGAEFYVRSAMTSEVANGTIGQSINTQGAIGTSRSGGGWTNSSDTADSTGAMASSDNFDRGGPCLVLGRQVGARKPVIVGVGDSIMFGVGDTTTNHRAGGGFLVRGLGGTYALMNTAVASLPLSTIVSEGGTAYRLRQFWSMGTHAFAMQGTNDLANGRTASQLMANLITLGSSLVGRGLLANAATIPPCTTSTDSWATAGNQTVRATESSRVAVNGWIRAGLPIDSATLAPVAVGTAGALVAGQSGHPWVGYVEIADTVETARNSGIWVAGATSDGIHPNSTGAALMAAPVSTWAATLTV